MGMPGAVQLGWVTGVSSGEQSLSGPTGDLLTSGALSPENLVAAVWEQTTADSPPVPLTVLAPLPIASEPWRH